MTPTADLIITNGRVFDGRTRTESTAVAVADGRIVRIGSDIRVEELAGAATRVVDAGGGLIHPGFVDAHAHAVFAGVERLSLDLTPARTVEETLALIREGAERKRCRVADRRWMES
ncbi:amidohydrolase family protein [Microbacterium elymi]|uniref:Amidohydrolase family protein n=1 Tax=Microbacterium elymi TaxID=2909587 RepID=A0ABY5NLC6_9MICO|nr:amidohydrolase family protein [Microbacterium elymi]UUT35976.1 amidohydrolase family protein [Microbacterium elymi]